MGRSSVLWYRGCLPLAASLGAVITIAALAVDPLSQQLLHLHGWNETVHEGVASLPRTQLLDEVGGHIGAGLSAMSGGFLGSLAAGQFSSRPPQVPFSCATGNCTFPQAYSSVGYCSSCTDITDKLVFEDFQTLGSGFNVTVRLNVSDEIFFLAGDSLAQGMRFSMNGNSVVNMVWFEDSVHNTSRGSMNRYPMNSNRKVTPTSAFSVLAFILTGQISAMENLSKKCLSAARASGLLSPPMFMSPSPPWI